MKRTATGPLQRQGRRLQGGLAAFALGLLLTLLLLEGGLRIVGWSQAPDTNPVPTQDVKEAFTVLCLGDSFTFGLGAPAGRSWPKQLNERLQARGITANVINLGHSSATTTTVLNTMDEALDAAHPDAVFLLVGNANQYDFREFHAWADSTSLLGRLKDAIWDLRAFRLLTFLATDLRQRDLPAGRPQAPGSPLLQPNGPITPPPNCPEGMLSLHRDAGEVTDPAEHEYYLERYQYWAARMPICGQVRANALGAALQLQRTEQALDLFLEGVRLNPEAGLQTMLISHGKAAEGIHALEQQIATQKRALPEQLVALGDLYESLGRFDDSFEAYENSLNSPNPTCSGAWGKVRVALRLGDERLIEQAITAFSRRPVPGCQQLYGIVSLLCSRGDKEASLAWFKQALSDEPHGWSVWLNAVHPCLDTPDLVPVKHMLLDAGIPGEDLDTVFKALERGAAVSTVTEPWIRSELEEITARVRSRGIPVFHGTYPFPSRVNGLLREVASSEGVLLADYEKRFLHLVASGEPRTDYFSNDGDNPLEQNDHCNERGYGIMADEALLTLEQAGLIAP